MIKNFGCELIFIDCTTARNIAFYRAILFYIGENKFNQLFREDDGLPFISPKKNKLSRFLSGRRITNRIGKPGSTFYVHNHILYKEKNLFGYGQGFHLMVLENDPSPKFIGFDIPPEGCTLDEVRRLLIENFNKKAHNQKFVSNRLFNFLLPLWHTKIS